MGMKTENPKVDSKGLTHGSNIGPKHMAISHLMHCLVTFATALLSRMGKYVSEAMSPCDGTPNEDPWNQFFY